jgi:hypothetical protein
LGLLSTFRILYHTDLSHCLRWGNTTLKMSQDSVPTLRRSHSSSNPSTAVIDPHDQAEQGFHSSLIDDIGKKEPVKARKILSLQYSLPSSDNTTLPVPLETLELGSHDRSSQQLPGQSKSLLTRSRYSKALIIDVRGIASFCNLGNKMHPSHKEFGLKANRPTR